MTRADGEGEADADADADTDSCGFRLSLPAWWPVLTASLLAGQLPAYMPARLPAQLLQTDTACASCRLGPARHESFRANWWSPQPGQDQSPGRMSPPPPPPLPPPPPQPPAMGAMGMIGAWAQHQSVAVYLASLSHNRLKLRSPLLLLTSLADHFIHMCTHLRDEQVVSKHSPGRLGLCTLGR